MTKGPTDQSSITQTQRQNNLKKEKKHFDYSKLHLSAPIRACAKPRNCLCCWDVTTSLQLRIRRNYSITKLLGIFHHLSAIERSNSKIKSGGFESSCVSSNRAMLAQMWHEGQDKGCGQEMLNNLGFTINIPPRQPVESKDSAALSSPRAAEHKWQLLCSCSWALGEIATFH